MHDWTAATIVPNHIVQSVMQIMHHASGVVDHVANRSWTATSRLAAASKHAQPNHHNQTDNKILHTSSVKKGYPKHILIIAHHAQKTTRF